MPFILWFDVKFHPNWSVSVHLSSSFKMKYAWKLSIDKSVLMLNCRKDDPKKSFLLSFIFTILFIKLMSHSDSSGGNAQYFHWHHHYYINSFNLNIFTSHILKLSKSTKSEFISVVNFFCFFFNFKFLFNWYSSFNHQLIQLLPEKLE